MADLRPLRDEVAEAILTRIKDAAVQGAAPVEIKVLAEAYAHVTDKPAPRGDRTGKVL